MPGPVTRKPIASAVQASVLVKSRRRCCICYGLDRDTGLKSGQIAHIDQNGANNKEENLTFLCFVHHDQYDSKTRQSKNFTEAEVRHFLSELTRDVRNAFNQPMFFGSTKTDLASGIEGSYTRVEGSSAEIILTALPISSDRFHVSGFALWGEGNEFGPNTGELDFSENFIEGQIELIGLPENPDYRIVIMISDGVLIVNEENVKQSHGMGVTFSGNYLKKCMI